MTERWSLSLEQICDKSIKGWSPYDMFTLSPLKAWRWSLTLEQIYDMSIKDWTLEFILRTDLQ